MAVINMDTLTTKKAMRWGFLGKSGSGKTRTAATAPDPFFIDGEKGVSGAKDILATKTFGGVEIVELGSYTTPKAWHHTMSIIDAFENGAPFNFGGDTINPDDYKTLVVDTWTTIGHYAFEEGKAEAKRMSRRGKDNNLQSYMYYDQYGKTFANKLLSISEKWGMNIVINFHLKPGQTDDDGNVITWDPYVMGRGLPPYLLAILDETWAMEARHTKDDTALIAHTRNYLGIDVLKSRHRFPNTIVNPNLTEILGQFRGTTR